MAIKRQDEVLAKAVTTDATVIPRYDIKRPDGTKVAENVALELKNTVVNEGTAVNKQLLDELLAASGTAGGTTSALTLAQDGFALVDGAVVRMKSTYNLAGGATLNVNGTGAKHIYTSWGEEVDTGIIAGVWMVLIYSSALDGYVIVNQTRKRKVITEIITQTTSWTCPDGVTSVHVRVFGAGAGGRAPSSGNATGGNGGGGGHMSTAMLTVVPGTTYPVTIGAGGDSNSAGGASSFGTLLSAYGAYDNDGGTGGGGGGASSTNYFHGNNGGDGDYGGGGGAGGGYGSSGTPGSPGTGGNGNNGANGNGTHGGNGGDGMAGGGGTGKGGTANQAGGGGGGYGGEGGTGNRGGGGGGGYGAAGKGGDGGEFGHAGSSGVLGGGGGGGGAYGTDGGKGGDGVVVITYAVEE